MTQFKEIPMMPQKERERFLGLPRQEPQALVQTVEMGPLSSEEEELKAALRVLRTLKEKYDPDHIPKYVRTLRETSRLQHVDKAVQVVSLRELRKFKVIQEIVEFQW